MSGLATMDNSGFTKDDMSQKISRIRDKDLTQDQVMDIYKSWANYYDSDMSAQEYHAPGIVLRLLEEALGGKKEARILDLGAGTGLAGMQFYHAGFHHLDALDGSPEMLAVAKQKGIYTDTVCHLLGPKKMNIPDDTYDAATILGCLGSSHVGESCLDEIIRIIKPGGYFIAAIREGMLAEQASQLEPTMQKLEKGGLWTTIHRMVDNYYNQDKGIYFVFQISVH